MIQRLHIFAWRGCLSSRGNVDCWFQRLGFAEIRGEIPGETTKKKKTGEALGQLLEKPLANPSEKFLWSVINRTSLRGTQRKILEEFLNISCKLTGGNPGTISAKILGRGTYKRILEQSLEEFFE